MNRFKNVSDKTSRRFFSNRPHKYLQTSINFLQLSRILLGKILKNFFFQIFND